MIYASKNKRQTRRNLNLAKSKAERHFLKQDTRKQKGTLSPFLKDFQLSKAKLRDNVIPFFSFHGFSLILSLL